MKRTELEPMAITIPLRRELPANAAAIMLEAELRGRIDGEVRFDRTSRMLYSTDASNYQIEPIGVVIPRHADDVHAAMELAAKHRISILPRGGGSGLAGSRSGMA
jgi:FAD/FMN-containing dehydrogenase